MFQISEKQEGIAFWFKASFPYHRVSVGHQQWQGQIFSTKIGTGSFSLDIRCKFSLA